MPVGHCIVSQTLDTTIHISGFTLIFTEYLLFIIAAPENPSSQTGNIAIINYLQLDIYIVTNTCYISLFLLKIILWHLCKSFALFWYTLAHRLGTIILHFTQHDQTACRSLNISMLLDTFGSHTVLCLKCLISTWKTSSHISRYSLNEISMNQLECYSFLFHYTLYVMSFFTSIMLFTELNSLWIFPPPRL